VIRSGGIELDFFIFLIENHANFIHFLKNANFKICYILFFTEVISKTNEKGLKVNFKLTWRQIQICFHYIHRIIDLVGEFDK